MSSQRAPAPWACSALHGACRVSLQASPHVAGAAALYAAKNPGATPAEIRAAITNSARPIPSMSGKVCSAGTLDIPNLLGYAKGKPSSGGIAC
jgi:subtilisin family serine protease